jgi:hypothetical protein
MAKIKTVFKNDDDGTYDFVCPFPTGCGKDGDPFTSHGWGRRADAAERGRQHIADHEGIPMPSLAEFRAERGLTTETAGQVDPSDIEF